MDWSHGDIAEEFKLFKERMTLCLEDNGVDDEAKAATKIKIAIGNEGLRRLAASGLTEENKKKPTEIWNFFEAQLRTNINFRIHRLELMRYKQKTEETLDDFVSRCRTKAGECDFSDEELAERLIELVIASTPYEGLQRELLEKEKGLAIPALLAQGRKYEAVSAGRKCLTDIGENKPIDAFFKKKPCGRCGSEHAYKACPAYRDHCKGCGKLGHWQICCRSTKYDPRQGRSQSRKRQSSNQRHGSMQSRRRPPSRGRSSGRGGNRRRRTPGRDQSRRPVDSVCSQGDPENEDGGGHQIFHAIRVSTLCLKDDDSEAFTTINVVCPGKLGDHSLKMKIDTGASGNTLPLRTIQQMYGTKWRDQVRPTTDRLYAYNDTRIKCYGTITLQCRHGTPDWHKEIFYIIDVPGPAVAGLRTCRRLNIVTIHTIEAKTQPKIPPITVNSIEDLKRQFPDQFDKIGSFKSKATLHLKDDAEPSIDAPRKCSIHLKEKLREELQKMEQQGVIRKVEHHVDWCSSITTSVKKDGSLRMCLDPKRLNQNLKRCPHKIPTLEEITPIFAKAKYFSKFDAKAGYWSVHLDEESQELTTFRTPFGRYCYTRLPFGLNVSQDIFQQHMDQIIDKVPGCEGIADDVIVVGETEEEHDSNVINLMMTAKEDGLVFNSDKCVIKADAVEFFGSLYTNSGVHPDPAKVEDIKAMPTPQDKEDLQRFIGLMTYLSQYIPRYADKSAVLRDLLKKDTPFLWHEDHEAAFVALKEAITAETCLQYFDRNSPTVLEVDASMKGLGACLVQKGRPVAFASKSLTPCEANYSNIERETLALVFGITRFHT